MPRGRLSALRPPEPRRHPTPNATQARFCAVSTTLQRLVGVLALLVAGVLSLPVAAYFLDDRGTEDWIIPVQLLAMAAIGTGVTLALPALGRSHGSTARRVLTGAGLGLLAALVGVLVFWLLISGSGGA